MTRTLLGRHGRPSREERRHVVEYLRYDGPERRTRRRSRMQQIAWVLRGRPRGTAQ